MTTFFFVTEDGASLQFPTIQPIHNKISSFFVRNQLIHISKEKTIPPATSSILHNKKTIFYQTCRTILAIQKKNNYNQHYLIIIEMQSGFGYRGTIYSSNSGSTSRRGGGAGITQSLHNSVASGNLSPTSF